VRYLWALAWASTVPGCSDPKTQSAQGTPDSRELIPAEWTVAEDTSRSGEVITVSVQLPTAKDITGLMDDETPRLVLRCLAGTVAVSIDTEMLRSDTVQDLGTYNQAVHIALDSAPACE
jgi:hypothetical protein